MKRRTLAAALAVGALAIVACGTNRRNAAVERPDKGEEQGAANAQAASPLLAGNPDGARQPYTYNPTNGTVSQGDVWRVKDGPDATASSPASLPALQSPADPRYVARARQADPFGQPYTFQGSENPARPKRAARLSNVPASAAPASAEPPANVYRFTNAFSLADYANPDGSIPAETVAEQAQRPEGAANERYARVADAPFTLARAEPLSTFGVDVDTASYANARRYLNDGTIPPSDAVRVEEFVNYFRYDYPQPQGDEPFSVNIATSECPWQPDHRLARIGLGGREIAKADRPPCNLVFLVDVSGSMNSADKLPLVQKSLKKLVGELGAKDRIAMVVYAGNSGLVLESTPGSARETIFSAIDRLKSGGSTNGGAGIQLAYDTAAANMIEGGANRVVLCTDGDFNVGTTDTNQLVDMVAERAKQDIFLTVLGFGTGNLNDAMMEQIADRGNGHYAYIDSESEARKTLVEQAGGTLVTIAKDVKIQVEFNPAQVQAWRLVGYSNRLLAHADFNNDAKDAGDIGAGHQVTALYEIVPVGVDMGDEAPTIDELKYQTVPPSIASAEYMTVKLRYKRPDRDASSLIERAAVDGGSKLVDCDDDFIFAASVASFGMMLRGGDTASVLTPEAISELAKAAKGNDPEGRREEFVQLVNKYATLAEGVAMNR